MRRAAGSVGLTLWVLTCAGCVTTTQVDPAGLEAAAPIQNAFLRAWRVAGAAGSTLGYVVLFGDPEQPDSVERQSFSVRNPWQQELGAIDGLGRAFRFAPHGSQPEWLGSGTIVDGARRILGQGGPATLQEVPRAALEGSPRPPA